MNDETQFSLYTLLAMGAWLGTSMLLALAWMVWLLDFHTHLAILVAETACALSAVAAVLQIRCYCNRICALIRLSSGQRTEADVRQFGPHR